MIYMYVAIFCFGVREGTQFFCCSAKLFHDRARFRYVSPRSGT